MDWLRERYVLCKMGFYETAWIFDSNSNRSMPRTFDEWCAYDWCLLYDPIHDISGL